MGLSQRQEAGPREERGGGTSVMIARAKAGRTGEQRLTGLSTPEQMQSCHMGAVRRLSTASPLQDQRKPRSGRRESKS